jgi:hypothetical protein
MRARLETHLIDLAADAGAEVVAWPEGARSALARLVFTHGDQEDVDGSALRVAVQGTRDDAAVRRLLDALAPELLTKAGVPTAAAAAPAASVKSVSQLIIFLVVLVAVSVRAASTCMKPPVNDDLLRGLRESQESLRDMQRRNRQILDRWRPSSLTSPERQELDRFHARLAGGEVLLPAERARHDDLYSRALQDLGSRRYESTGPLSDAERRELRALQALDRQPERIGMSERVRKLVLEGREGQRPPAPQEGAGR